MSATKQPNKLREQLAEIDLAIRALDIEWLQMERREPELFREKWELLADREAIENLLAAESKITKGQL
jgi:hypothetical protein